MNYFDNELNRMRNCTAVLDRSLITQDEYVRKVTLTTVDSTIDIFDEAVATIPDRLIKPLLDYFDREVRPYDFMPSAGFFIVDQREIEEERAKRIEMRPKYLRLYELLRRRFEQFGEQGSG